MSKIPNKLVTFIIGSACSGKSTLSGYLGRKGHGITFRASQCLEEYVAHNCKGKTLKDYIGSDYLAHIPDLDDADYLCNGIIEKIKSNDRVVVDGFPRSLHQIFTLKRYIFELTEFGHMIRIVNLTVPVEELVRRMHIRGRPDDTEPRIIAEVEIHRTILREFKLMVSSNNKMTMIEFVVPDNAGNVTVKREFAKIGSQKPRAVDIHEISFIDSISRRLNDIFCDLESRRAEGFSNKSHFMVQD